MPWKPLRGGGTSISQRATEAEARDTYANKYEDGEWLVDAMMRNTIWKGLMKRAKYYFDTPPAVFSGLMASGLGSN